MHPARPELLSLLQTAREHPDEPMALLVVADWLEENGDALDRDRSELVRLSVRGVLPHRYNELAAKHRARWLGPLIAAGADPRLVGGMAHANLDAKAVFAAERQGAHQTEEWAWLSFASLVCAPPEAAKVAASAVLGTVPSLRLSVVNSALAHLLRSPHLEGLRALSLRHGWLHEDGARIVAASPSLAGLRSLTLSDNPFGDRGLAALLASPHLAGVETLDLAKTGLRHGVADLAGSRAFPALKHLDLSRNDVGSDGARALATSRWNSLRTLRLEACGMGDPAVAVLAASEPLRGLKELQLGGNSLTDTGAAALAATEWPEMEWIGLSKTKCTAVAERMLRGAAGLPRLKRVDL